MTCSRCGAELVNTILCGRCGYGGWSDEIQQILDLSWESEEVYAETLRHMLQPLVTITTTNGTEVCGP